MSQKKITFTAKPEAPLKEAQMWVGSRQVDGEPLMRFTIDLPQSLHRKFKANCAMHGKKMADVIRTMIKESLEDGKP